MTNRTTSKSINGGSMTSTTEYNGVKTTTTVPALKPVVLAYDLVNSSYRQHKVWNNTTQAYITVTMTGNDAQDAALLAVALSTAGERMNSVISST